MSCELGEMRRRRRHPPSPAAAPSLEDEDLLAEILLRLPPQPSSLPRVSAVCHRWRSLASDPGFSRGFRRHHRRSPPILGCFMEDGKGFEPTLEPPNRVPQGRFHFPVGHGFTLLGCRHGFLLMLHASRGTLELLVWDPINAQEHPVAIPPGFGKIPINGAVLGSALGGIQSFQVVLVSTDVEQGAIACVYLSETGEWGNLITTPLPPNVSDISLPMVEPNIPAVLVGDCLYILLLGNSSSILEFNVDRQSLAVIPAPVGLKSEFSRFYSVMRAEGGGLGLLFLSTSDGSAQLWKRNIGCDGVSSWVLGKTIELHKLLSPDLPNKCGLQIEGLAEENNVVFLWSFVGIFMVQLDSLQFKKLPDIRLPCLHPFECVYAAGMESDILVAVMQK